MVNWLMQMLGWDDLEKLRKLFKDVGVLSILSYPVMRFNTFSHSVTNSNKTKLSTKTQSKSTVVIVQRKLASFPLFHRQKSSICSIPDDKVPVTSVRKPFIWYPYLLWVPMWICRTLQLCVSIICAILFCIQKFVRFNVYSSIEDIWLSVIYD